MFLLPHETAQKVLDYLVKRPYEEVFQLIDQLTTLKKVTETPTSPPATHEGETNGRS